MFEVCELIVPALSPACGLIPRRGALGAADDDLLRGGVAFAQRHVFATRHRIDLGDGGARDVCGWTALRLDRSINAAAKHDETWAAFLRVLYEIVAAHDTWIFCAEADPDQHPLDRAGMTPDALMACLDRERRAPSGAFALVAWPPGQVTRQFDDPIVGGDALAPIDAELRARIRASDDAIGDLDDPDYGEAVARMLLFEHYPDLVERAVPALSARDYFYNRYFWTTRLAARFQAKHGYDAGLEQWVFQLLEGAAAFAPDWALLEALHQRALGA